MKRTAWIAAGAAALVAGGFALAPRFASPPEPPSIPAAERDDPDFARALDAALAAVAADPRAPRPRAELGMLYDVHGIAQQAIDAYGQALDLGADVRVRWLRARLTAATGRVAEAIPEYRAVAGADPGYAPARIALALALAGIGDGKGALAAAEDAASRFPNDAAASLALAEIASEHGARERAIQAARRAARVADPGTPAQRRADRVLARLLDAAGAADEARAALSRAGPPDTSFAWPDPWALERFRFVVSFDRVLEVASADTAAGHPDVAIPRLRALLARRPDHAEVRAQLGAALRAVGSPKDAIPVLEEAVRRAPERRGLRLQLALAREEAGDAAGALRDLDAVLLAAPADGEALEVRGGVRARAGHADAAVADIDASERAGRVSAEGQVVAGVALVSRQRFEDAERRFRRASEIDAAWGDAWGGLAWAAALRGDRREADLMLSRADAVAPWGAPLARKAREVLAAPTRR